jgi:hypothetical protein
MDTSLFVISPIYAIFGLVILALVAGEYLRTKLATRRRHHRHHHHHHAA